MRLVSTPRVEFARELADLLWPQLDIGRTILAIDGPRGAGGIDLAADLAAVLHERDHAVFVAHAEAFRRRDDAIDDFGAETPEREVRFALDESAMRRALIEPFEFGGSAAFVTAVVDPARDAWVQPKWLTGPPDAVLIIEGRFLLRARLAEEFDHAISIEADAADDAERWALAHPVPTAAERIVVLSPGAPWSRRA